MPLLRCDICGCAVSQVKSVFVCDQCQPPDATIAALHARVAELEAAILETGGTFYHEIYGDTCIFCDRTDRKHEDDCIYNQLRVKARQPLPQPPEEAE